MRVIVKGHVFQLQKLDWAGVENSKSTLVFVMRQGDKFPGNDQSFSGTTSQEVLRALISRAKYVNNQIWCWPTWLSIWAMRGIIFIYEWRAKRIKGKWLSPVGFSKIEDEYTCLTCGHIRCSESHYH